MGKAKKIDKALEENLGRHPSPIAQAALAYLTSAKMSDRTKQDHGMILSLFIESLKGDAGDVEENEDGEYVLIAPWESFYGGAVENFVDWWLKRKWIGPDEVARKAPGVLRKWFKWCRDEGRIDQERYDDFMDALPRRKASEVKRLQKAGELLYLLHSPNPGSWMQPEPNKVVPLQAHKEPEDYFEGYMTVVELDGGNCILEEEEGEKIGPVFIGPELSKHLRVGDVMNATIGLAGGSWKVLESGNVYAEGTV